MDEFKLQFNASMMTGGSLKLRSVGGKYYVAGFVQGREFVHESKVRHRTATDAILYAHKVIERYRRMAGEAFRQWLEKVNEVENVPAS